MTHEQRYQAAVGIQRVITLGARHGGAVRLKERKHQKTKEKNLLLYPLVVALSSNKPNISYITKFLTVSFQIHLK